MINFLKNLFKRNKKNDEWDVHKVVLYYTMKELFEAISGTDKYNHKDLYYYKGYAENLVKIISCNAYDGEEDVNLLSLDYVTYSKVDSSDTKTVFKGDLFFSDNVKDIKSIKLTDRFVYINADGKVLPINCAVMARDAVYLCSK